MGLLAFLSSLFHALLTILLHRRQLSADLQLCLSGSVLTNSWCLIRQEAGRGGKGKPKVIAHLCSQSSPAAAEGLCWGRVGAAALGLQIAFLKFCGFRVCPCYSTEGPPAQTGGQRYPQSICHFLRAMKGDIKQCHRSMKSQGIMAAP